MDAVDRDRTLPVSVLTGFLGAGKTTLLNRLLKDPYLSNAAIIINEFGEVGLDHLLVERADGDVLEMASGCLCCTIRGDLVDTLNDLAERRSKGEIKAFDRVVIETTGLADPAPVLQTLMSEPGLLVRYRLENIVTVVDAVNGPATLDDHEEAVRQVAVADKIVVSKADLLSGGDGEAQLGEIVSRVRSLAPAARLLTTHNDEASADKLFDGGASTAALGRKVDEWLGLQPIEAASERRKLRGRRSGRGDAVHETHEHADHHHDVNRHDQHIRSFSITHDKAIGPMQFDLFLQLLQSYHGPNLLRFKGIVKLTDDERRPVVVHGVQHVMHPPQRLDDWPDDDHRSRLVFIVRDIHREEMEKLLRAFTDPISGGAEAFSDDTLSLRRGK